MVLKQNLQRHQRQMAALSVSAEPAASQCPTALSLLGSVLEERHVQTHPMCSTATRCSARCYHYSPTGDGKTDSGKLKLVPFVLHTSAVSRTTESSHFYPPIGWYMACVFIGFGVLAAGVPGVLSHALPPGRLAALMSVGAGPKFANVASHSNTPEFAGRRPERRRRAPMKTAMGVLEALDSASAHVEGHSAFADCRHSSRFTRRSRTGKRTSRTSWRRARRQAVARGCGCHTLRIGRSCCLRLASKPLRSSPGLDLRFPSGSG
jgi:hypothetical protein